MTRSLRITDHAVLRYLERKEGIDVEAVRRRIKKTIKPLEDNEDANALNVDGLVYRVGGNAIATVVTVQMQAERLTRKARKK